jgi:hypothetical protein
LDPAKEFSIPDKQDRIARRNRQAIELEANQRSLKVSIAESTRLVEEADAMIQRHRSECDAADGK